MAAQSNLTCREVEGLPVMSRSRCFGAACLATVLWLTPAASSHAQATGQADLSKLREEVTALSLELLKAQAEAAELKDEKRVLTTEPEGAEASDSRFFRAPEKVWERAFPENPVRDDDTDHVLERLADAKKTIDRHQKDAESTWTSAAQRMLDLRKRREDIETVIGWRMDSPRVQGALRPA